MREYLYANDINDYDDEIINDDIVKFIPSVVQREWHSYKLYQSRKYFVINRNHYNDYHSYFLERDYYKYEYEKTIYTINVIKEHFVPTIAHYLKDKKYKKIGENLKIVYNKMMDYFYDQIKVHKYNLDKNDY